MAEHKFDMDPFFVEPNLKHKSVTLSVRNQDTMTWFAKKPFTIFRFQPKDDKKNAPYPFHFDPAMELESEEGTDGIWRINSGPPRKEAIGFGYEAKFRHGTRRSPAAQAAQGDPDVDIGP